MCRFFFNLGASTSWNPQGLSRPVMGLLYLTNSMEHNYSSRADHSCTSQQIPRILWHPNVRYRIHNSSPLVPVVSQINTLHTLTTDLFHINVNIILPSTPRPSKFSLSRRIPHQNSARTASLPQTRQIPSPISFSLDTFTLIVFGEKYQVQEVQRGDTARTLPNFCVVLCILVLFYILFVLCRSLYCLCVNVYCTTATG